MAKIRFKSYIKSGHGRMGNVIYYNVKGYQYARSYSIPRNPRTEAQQKNRACFAEAVSIWQCLTEKEKSRYNRMAAGKPLSGYNLFISMQMKGLISEKARMVKVKDELIHTPYTLRSTSVPPSSPSTTASLHLHRSVKTPGIPPDILYYAA